MEVMEKDRPQPVEFTCVDCGRAVTPTEAVERRLTTTVIKKECPSCHGNLRDSSGAR
jgi:hypothetical protein